MNQLQVISSEDKAKEILTLISKRDQLRERLNQLDERYHLLKDELLMETRRLGVLTLKTEKYIIVRKSVTTPIITDEAQAIADLQKRQIMPIMRLDTMAMKPTLLAALKESKPIKGTDARTTEYLSIKNNKG